VLVISGHEKGALTAITQIDALKVYVPILAMTHCDSAQIAEKLGQAAEYAFCANQWHETLGYREMPTPSSARRASTPRRCGTRSLRPSSTPSTAP